MSNFHGDKAGCALCCTKINNLTVKKGNTEILTDVNLHLHCGELTAITGPNGAGKSTLLKALVGEVPSCGTVTFHDADERFFKPTIGYVPQNPGFSPETPVSVYDLFVSVTKYPLWLPGGKRRRKSVLDALARTDAQHLIDRKLGYLSGGEAQRVMLALALSPLPELLLLDEPFSGVDTVNIDAFYSLIDSLRSRYDLSIVVVSHDMSYIRKYADRVVLISRRVLASGTPQEVFASEEFRSLYGEVE